jgi:transposase
VVTPGRPSQFDEEVMKALDEALSSKSPQDYGISRNRWDGIVVTEYLKRVHYIKIQVRHAQRLMKKLGYSLRRPVYRYVQATEAGVKEFHEKLKKTPSRPKE